MSSTDGFISYCDNGKYLVAYDLIGTVYVLNASTYRIESKIALGTMRAQDAHGTVLGVRMACSAGGNVFAVSAYGGRFGLGLIRLFDFATGEQIAELKQDSSSGAEFAAVDLSPNGSKLAILLQAPQGLVSNAESISKSGNAVTIASAKTSSIPIDNDKLIVGKTVSFQVQTGSGPPALTNISGLSY